ncbi:ExeM/NucH family extracellular endonuclease, partial [Nocardioides sp.]|uniref:ExeM/NucH family extracellular endonuclease n=1 Tax=Nocardioides sp. TaxID=35761 RepID=UPI002729196C
MLKHVSARRGLIGSLVAGLVVTPLAVGLTTAPAQAVSTTVVISEVYGAGGNGTNPTYTADFIELHNPSTSPVSVSGWSVQYRATAGSTVTNSAAGITPLTGTIPAGGYYLVKEADGAAAGTATLPTPNATGTIGLAGGSGQVLLVSNTTASTVGTGNLAGNAALVDMVGYGTASSFETQATTTVLTNVTSAQRSPSLVDTDHNNNDFSEALPTPTAGASALAVTNPGDKSAVAGTPIADFTIAASGGSTPYTWGATGLPTGVTISNAGVVSGTPTTAGTYSVTATVTDATTPTAATASTTFTITVSAAPAAQNTIAEIQGTTDTTPFANAAVTTTGVVTAAYPTGGLSGFYLQTGGPDTTPDASDGIFVFGSATNLPAASYPTVGSTVTVTGTAKEFVTNGKNQTEIELTAPGAVTTAATAQPAVVTKSLVPGTDCAQGSCPATAAAINDLREKTESELYAPTGSYTVTDPYDGSPFPSTSSANFGEIGLAAESTVALKQPTELYDTQTQAQQITDRVAYNDAKRIILDDGSSLNYTLAANTGSAIPWLTATHTVRVGAAVTFPQPVVLTPQFDGWTFLPSGGQVVGNPTGKVNFAQDRPAAPGAVGGDIKLGTANVLNYFPTTGNEFVGLASGNTCTYFTDRAGNQITNNSCNPNGPRGAANTVNLQRQQDKIVRELNTLGASIISLEEVENSAKFGKDRDFALSTLVAALNADAGAGTWAFAPSAAAADLPTLAQQDVIRNAFIYKPAVVSLVGPSKVLTTESSDTAPIGAFSDAREPLAQGFKGVNQGRSKAFTVITNHFKSKGSGTPDPIQGNANDRRILQANALKTFAQSFSDNLNGSGAIFLTGDFNAYEQEDPVQVLTSSGYTALASTTTPGESSYSFSGLDGSLDHVFANAKANAMVSGVDIWNINANESVYYEYSRFNYNITNLYTNDAFRASDHNPEVIGINLDQTVTPAVDVQILATNDFHGRIANDTTSGSAGAAVLAGAVKQFRAANSATSF